MKILLDFFWKKGKKGIKDFVKTLLLLGLVIAIVAATVVMASFVSGLVMWSVSFGQMFACERMRVFGWWDLATYGLSLLIACSVVGFVAKEITEWAIQTRYEFIQYRKAAIAGKTVEQ